MTERSREFVSLPATILLAFLSCYKAERDPKNLTSEAERSFAEAILNEEQATSEFVVTGGTIKGIRVGDDKRSVARSLIKQREHYVQPVPAERILIHAGEDVARLGNAERIVVGSGDIVITFEKDTVSRVDLVPGIAESSVPIHLGQTRREVAAALPGLINLVSPSSAHNETSSGRVDLREALLNPSSPLWRYDDWSLHMREPDGLWRLELHFVADALRAVSVLHSASELP